MADTSPRHGVILQGTIDHFLTIQCCLPQIVTLAKQVMQWREKFDLVFEFEEATGSVVNIKVKESKADRYSGFMEEMLNDHIKFCEGTCDILVDELQNLAKTWASLDLALGELPPEIHQELCGVRLRCHSWRALVRKYAIMPLERWPRLSSREEWLVNRVMHPRRALMPQRADHVLDYLAETDPTEFWKKIIWRIDSFIEDVRIAAVELNIKVQVDLDGPHGSRHWSWKGRISKSELTEKPNKLAQYLWEKLGQRVPIKALKGKDGLFESVQDSTVQRHGSNISNFFLDEGIPLVVESGTGDIWMQKLKTEG